MIGDKKILAVTLARGGSKSIPKKNIVEICGKPLLYYTIAEAQKSQYIDRYVVSTDDEDIKKVAEELGVEVVDRPKSLATSTTPSSESLIHAIQEYDGDYIVELMATNPLKKSSDIDACIEILHEQDCDSVVSVVRIYDHHPARVKYIEDGVMKDFYPEVPESRRQDLQPPAYVRNGSIYTMKRSFLEKEKTRYDKKTVPYIMNDMNSINIDMKYDLLVARAIMKGGQ